MRYELRFIAAYRSPRSRAWASRNRPAAGELGHLALVAQAPEREGVAVSSSQATPVQRSRKIVSARSHSLLGLGPPPFEVGGDAPGQRHHAERVGMLDATAQVLGDRQQPRRSSCGSSRRWRPRGPPPSPGPGRSATARPPRATGAARAPGSRPPGSCRRRSGRRRPTSRRRSGSGRPAAISPGSRSRKPSPRSRNRAAPPAGARSGPVAGCRAGHADRLEHRLERGEPLVDVAADQELHGRAALQLEGLGDRGVRARRRGRRSPPRHRGRRWPGRRPGARAAVHVLAGPGRLELQREAVERRGAVEGQRLGGLSAARAK